MDDPLLPPNQTGRTIGPLFIRSVRVRPCQSVFFRPIEEHAEAKLAGGENAHIMLKKFQGIAGDTGILENIAYFGAPRNDGFKMMPNTIETWKVGDKAFAYSGTTGFMITVDMSSGDLSD